MNYFVGFARTLLLLFILLLFARIVFSWVMAYARDWKPTGPMLLLAEGTFTVTDPPIKALRRVIPPVTMGQIRLDFAMMLLLLASFMAYGMLGSLRFL